MSKIKCKCDNIIWLGEIPSPSQWMIISDVEYEQYSGLVNAADFMYFGKVSIDLRKFISRKGNVKCVKTSIKHLINL